MTKQEKIKEAYGKYWDEFDKYISYDAWTGKSLIPFFNVSEIEFKGNLNRPKLLTGIENNNGWIKIEKESDLPTQDGMYWGIYEDDPNPICIRLMNSKPVVLFGCLSHIKHIPNPEPPIY